MRLKDRLRKLRTEQGRTLTDLAEAAGVSVSFLSTIEHGRKSPSLKTLEALASALGVSVQYLLAGVEFEPEPEPEPPPDPDELPEGLRQLLANPRYQDHLDADWVALLSKIQLRGKRPQTEDDWLGLYLYLKLLLK